MIKFRLLAIAAALTGLLGLSPAVGDDAAETPPPMDFQKRQGVGVGMAVSLSLIHI